MKKFIEEQKRQIKFKLAGPGHRLASDGASNSNNDPSSASLNAALQRCGKQPSDHKGSSSSQPVKRSSIEISSAATTSSKEPKETNIYPPSCRVLFNSPELGEGAYTMDIWMEKVKAYIEEKKSTDQVEASIISIKTLNPENEAQFATKVLKKYVSNLINYPDEEKYKIIRLGNPNIQKLMGIQGAVEFLSAVGFENKAVTFEDDNQQKEETYLVYIGREDMDLTGVLEALESVRGIGFSLHRNIKVTYPGSEGLEEEPDEFYEWTIQDMKKESKFRQIQSEKNMQLRTRKMREEFKSKPKCDYTFVRARLPNGAVVQATFSTNEKLADLRALLNEKFQLAQKFIFVLLPTKNFEESEDNKTFFELDLYPSVTLMVKWSSDLDSIPPDILLKQDN